MSAGIYIGIFLGLFLYNLFLGVRLRDASHVLYCAFLATMAAHVMVRDGVMPGFGPDFIFERGGGMTASGAVLLVFARRFLRLRERHPKIDKLLLGQLALTILLFGLALVGVDVAAPSIASVGLSVGVVIAGGVAASRTGDRAARIFLLAWSVLLVSSFLGVLHAFGVVHAPVISQHGLRVGSAVEMVLLALALAERVRSLRDEKERAEVALEKARADAQSELTSRVLDAEERERARFAQELHDGIGHALLGVKERLRRASRKGEPIAPEDADQMAAQAQGCIDDARAMARDLRPPSLRSLGIVAAVRAVVHDHAQPKVELEVVGSDADEAALDKLLGDRGIHLVRIVQEALTNVTKHANAQHVRVHLDVSRAGATPGGFELIVDDDGAGLNASAPKGLGLLGMEQRARLLAGTLTVGPGPGGKGTRVVCRTQSAAQSVGGLGP